MSIVRTKRKKHDFSIIDNTALVDPTLTWKETGLLAFLMTKPDDWKVSIKSLCNNKTDGKDSVSTALTGLQKKGYVYRLEKRDEGRFVTEYIVFETKEDLKWWVESEEGKTAIAEQKKHRDGFPGTVRPKRLFRNGLTETVNPPLVITDIDITDQQITEKVIKNPPIVPQEAIATPAANLQQEGGKAIATVAEVVEIQNPQSASKQIAPNTISPLPTSTNTVATSVNSALEQNVPARENGNQTQLVKAEAGFVPTQIQKYAQVYEKNGKLPREEFRAWANYELREVLPAYRSSAIVLCQSPNDVSLSFLEFLVGQQKNLTLNNAARWVTNCESDPGRWQELSIMVGLWEAHKTTGKTFKDYQAKKKDDELREAFDYTQIDFFGKGSNAR